MGKHLKIIKIGKTNYLFKFFYTIVLIVVLNLKSVQIENDDVNAVFLIPRARRGDTGNYEVKLENSEGSDCLPIKITVLDKPGKCEGPVELLDSSKTTVTLAWKPPKDDGGSDVTGKHPFFLFL
jgi:hypothetical protein